MADRFVVLQDLAVFDFEVNGTQVLVDLYGGPANTCGVARFTLQDPAHRRQALVDLEHWRLAGTPLTLVESDDRLSLLRPQSVFTSEFQDPIVDDREDYPSS